MPPISFSKVASSLILIIAVCLSQPASAQKDTITKERYKSYLYAGFGVGLDYSGFGARIEFMALDHLGIFAALGHSLADVGYNAGLTLRALPDRRVTPVFTAMYGYNGAIITTYNGKKITGNNYYGLSFGTGLEFSFGRRNSHINFNLLVPIRSEQFRNDIQWASSRFAHGILFSLGFNFAL